MGHWCSFRDSDPGPTDYESVALPTELKVHLYGHFYAPSKLNIVTVVLYELANTLSLLKIKLSAY